MIQTNTYFLQLSTSMYGVDLDAPPSSSPDSIVVVPQVTIEDEEGSLERLEDIDPLSPACDDDHGIGCYFNCIEALCNFSISYIT